MEMSERWLILLLFQKNYFMAGILGKHIE